MNVNRRGVRPANVTRPTAPPIATRPPPPTAAPTGGRPSSLAEDRYRSAFEPGNRPLEPMLDGPNTSRSGRSRSAQPSGTADDTVAIFDAFGRDHTHGNMVQYVLQSHSPSTRPSGIRQVAVGSSARGSLNHSIEQSVTSFLNSTSDAIQSVLNNPGRIRVINQSMSTSELRVVSQYLGRAQRRPEGLRNLARELGLPANASNQDIRRGLVARVDHIFESSSRIRDAKARYNELSNQLERRGILHVVTAGNTGNALRELEGMGIPGDQDFTRSVLFNRNTIVVGASLGRRPDGIANLSTPTPFVTVAIDGTNIRVAENQRPESGTSFAAPQVTATIAEMRHINPRLTNAQVRDILRKAATNTRAPAYLEGAGILNPARALELARQSRSQNTPRGVS